jgi:hypothetical protein
MAQIMEMEVRSSGSHPSRVPACVQLLGIKWTTLYPGEHQSIGLLVDIRHKVVRQRRDDLVRDCQLASPCSGLRSLEYDPTAM